MFIIPEWTPEFEKSAADEGWLISETYIVGHAYEVQRIDDPEAYSEATGNAVPHLGCDAEAWALVMAGTRPYHVAARDFLAYHSPRELELMMEHVRINS
ncbi:hypothetical protein QE320_gp073 [Pseudomonas phage EM]|uniref:Uncharacterized protein n=1 Tax=Pseudomonas phage EM TaxID=2936914 RepID=A0AAE9HKF7_9CAUD|nr:hypothetical protein QE320_gp073 [Pseudomonas phage EM]UPW35981.1 hypothetical protein EM_196 [Pseudomonas phage EM]